MKLCCGIDLGMRPGTTMAFMAYEGGEFLLQSEIYTGLTDEQIETLVLENQPEVIAIDAPLSTSMKKERPAEGILREQLKEYSPVFSASSVSSPFTNVMFPITYRGRHLLQRLQNISNVIETHPLLDYAFLDGNPENAERLKSRKKDTRILYEILNKYVSRFQSDINDNQCDALIAAMVACCYSEKESPIPLERLPKLYNTDAEFVVFSPQL